ncbi:acylneuraminate cytidylyltransferase family protein [Gracilibacillus suaedae]|uniref:acylneuraminate cytidylyltransferase family protein n=1 Tax=Gracilibacillus suaedae TaxID=2820273 RepID=UPI001ABE61FF|nr:acylneuraminate cytidylyltransferase family protein [Gracilibacillus suaedae]
MYKGNTFLAIIPARAGSKGIPNKNIKQVSGKPLIQYTIDEAKKSKYLDRIIVSTDSSEIASISSELGAEIPFLRPKEYATDKAKTIDVLLHTINNFKQKNNHYDYVVLLQPTQPLRKFWHIDDAIQLLISNKKNSLVSINEVNEHPIFMRSIDENNLLVPILLEDSTVRRQDLKKYYKVNGAVYINKIDDTLGYETSLNDNEVGYIMDQIYDIDIDTEEDLIKFEETITKIKNYNNM